MSMCRSRTSLVVLGFLASCWIGCLGQPRDSGPKTYPVEGVVLQKGQPVEGATVTFMQPDGKNSSVGKTDSQGHFTLTTVRGSQGAVPGPYQVSIVKFEASTAAPAAGTSDKDYVPPTPGAAIPTAPAAPKNLLPAKFSNPTTSGLLATVKETPENKFEFSVDELPPAEQK
jgi:hypothetical protein